MWQIVEPWDLTLIMQNTISQYTCVLAKRRNTEAKPHTRAHTHIHARTHARSETGWKPVTSISQLGSWSRPVLCGVSCFPTRLAAPSLCWLISRPTWQQGTAKQAVLLSQTRCLTHWWLINVLVVIIVVLVVLTELQHKLWICLKQLALIIKNIYFFFFFTRCPKCNVFLLSNSTKKYVVIDI